MPVPALLDHLDAAGGVIGGQHLDTLEGAQGVLALGQGLRVRVHPLDLLQAHAGVRDQAVRHAQVVLRDDVQVVLEQQVIVPVDAPRQRVLHRHHAIGVRAVLHALKDLVKAIAGHRLDVCPKQRQGGLFAVGARLSLEPHPLAQIHQDAACSLRRVYSIRPPASIRASIKSG
jgi:hypothetical protein